MLTECVPEACVAPSEEVPLEQVKGQREVVEGRAHYDDPPWDAAGHEEPGHDEVSVQVGRVVKEPGEVVAVHDRHDDQPLAEPSQIEVPDDNHVDVVEEQPPPVQVEVEVGNPEPEVGSTRPRRTVKPNFKYSPDVNDLSYVGSKSEPEVGRVLEEQEHDDQVPVFLGGEGIAKSSLTFNSVAKRK